MACGPLLATAWTMLQSVPESRGTEASDSCHGGWDLDKRKAVEDMAHLLPNISFPARSLRSCTVKCWTLERECDTSRRDTHGCTYGQLHHLYMRSSNDEHFTRKVATLVYSA